MNVLHINHSDISGGAAIAGFRLHQALLSHGISSHILAGEVKTPNAHITKIPSDPMIVRKILRFTSLLGLNYINLVNTFDIPNQLCYKEADILNFHNLHGGYFNYLSIPKLTKDKPAVFTLHDMWSFTGHCANSFDCDRWIIGCGKCPYPDTYPEVRMDNTRLEWKLKKFLYNRSNLTIVTPSRWLTDIAKQSMLNRFPIHHINHGIDTETYKPLDPEQCRSVLGISVDKKVLMFGAQNLGDPGKGADLLIKALRTLPETLKAEVMILTIGEGGESNANAIGIRSLHLGYVGSDRLKAMAYSAADLFLAPTRGEAFGLVLQESMACATPMVSFRVGGVPELVRHDITGYLAESENVEDFSNGIVKLLEDESLRNNMSAQCRSIAREEFHIELQAKQYIELYKKILNK